MNNVFRSISVVIVITIMLFTSGCYSDGSSATGDDKEGTESLYITGTIAVGEALEADVVLIDEAGNQYRTRSDATGQYSILREGISGTFVIRAQTASITLYSYSDGIATVVNITPLTTVVVNNIAENNGASGGASDLFLNYEEYEALHDEVDVLTAEVELLNNILDELLLLLGLTDADGEAVDHFGDEFTADHTGYDELLDLLDMEYFGDDVVIRVEGTVIDTLDYNLSEDLSIEVSGKIVDGLTGAPLGGALLTFINHNTEDLSNTYSDIDGSFSLTVDNFRVYDIEITLDGYIDGIYENIDTFLFSNISTQVIPLLPEGLSGFGTVKGKVLDARTQDTKLSGVTLDFRNGINNLDGEVVASAMTNFIGEYSLLLESGIYTVTYTLNGYTASSEIVTVLEGETIIYDTSLIGAVDMLDANAAVATIVLSWNSDPSDLDVHFTGPDINNRDRFHLAYYNQVYSKNQALIETNSSTDIYYEVDYENGAYGELYFNTDYMSAQMFTELLAEIEAIEVWDQTRYLEIINDIYGSLDYSIDIVETNYSYELLGEIYFNVGMLSEEEFTSMLTLAQSVTDLDSYNTAYAELEAVIYDFEYANPIVLDNYNYQAVLMGDLYYNYSWGYLTQAQFTDFYSQIELGTWDEFSYFDMSALIYESSDYANMLEEPLYIYQFLSDLAMNYGWGAMDQQSYDDYVSLSSTITDYDTYIDMLDSMYSNMYDDMDIETAVEVFNPCDNPDVIASIDRDAVSGFGPETTTLCQAQDEGLYSYYVHHFSGSSNMSDSPAEVTVTTVTGSRTFIAPSGAEETDEIWHVFNMDGNGNIYPINTYLGTENNSEELYAPSRTGSLKKDARFNSETTLLNHLPAK